MQNDKLKFKNEYINRRGFTLIELLVVIAIIGLLATLAVTSLNIAMVKARDARRLADIDSIKKAMDLFYSDYGEYDGISCPLSNKISDCDMSPYLVTANMTDPSRPSEICNGTNAGVCDYAFWIVPNGALRYMIFYHLEGATALGNSGEANCATNNLGTVCGKNGLSVNWLTYVGKSVAGCSAEEYPICVFMDSNGNGQIQNSDKNDYYY